MVKQLSDFTSDLTVSDLMEFTSEYFIPLDVHPVVSGARATIADFPEGKVGVYTRLFEFANQRVPLSSFLCDVLNYYNLHISQLHCIGAAKITNFEVNCRLLAINPTIHLFRYESISGSRTLESPEVVNAWSLYPCAPVTLSVRRVKLL